MEKSSCIFERLATTLSVLSRFWQQDNVRVMQGDILAEPMGFPKCEIVYSWGVLHHTGNMHLAILNASRLVQPGGLLVLALYGKTPYCGLWKRIKRWYCKADSDSREAAERWYIRLFGWYLLLRGKRLKDHIGNYPTKRGMDFHHDVRDWLGGYPYESISPAALSRILEPLGFECVKQNVKRRSGLFGSGCDEYVFRAR
jgi:2-polyprenyl-6-hydroxyphenyl methylase/3-demethylubiquinone-9 3-methyltransferase